MIGNKDIFVLWQDLSDEEVHPYRIYFIINEMMKKKKKRKTVYFYIARLYIRNIF